MTGASMKVGVVCAERERWPKMRWVLDALIALGHRVSAIHDKSHLASSDADLLLFEHKNAGLVTGDIVQLAKHRNCPWVQVWFDLIVTEVDKPLSDQPFLVPSNFGTSLRVFDKVFVRERDYIEDYHQLSINAEYLDQCCPSDLPKCRHPEKPDIDVFIFGSIHGYHQRRKDAEALVKAGFKVAWSGHVLDQGPPCGTLSLPFIRPHLLPEVASKAAVTLGVDYTHDIVGYWSDRLWLSTGMGSCHVRRFTPGLSDDIPMFVYHDHDQLIELVGNLVSDQALRADTGRRAREYTMENATYESRLTELLNKCQNLTANANH